MKQLKGFEKITPEARRNETMGSPIDIEALKFWNQQMEYERQAWQVQCLYRH
ncbi:hypothetical protein ACLK1T_23315 [Escherichia coli]